MFDLMFGWRKASQCKKLMKKLRCRLSLLKNKRCCIVKQLRNDVAQLIKHGHHQTAFHRVDEIYKDECIIAVYDLLAHFCEFLSHQLPYIRRSRDCPNDINEAISSIIFASARCGELPELLRIRKLFSERYGEHFEARALDLLPGNLVNFQIRENLSMISKVPNQVKYKLVEEITTAGPLALEKGQLNGNGKDIYLSPNQSDFDHRTDIEEFQAPLKEDGEDQRVFMFTASVGSHKSTSLLISIIDWLVRTGSKKRSSDSHPPAGEKHNCCIVKPTREVKAPCDRWKKGVDEEADGVMRCYSLPHVHPKLPDYDELAAKFIALKKEKVSEYLKSKVI
ncbi:putative vacuolar protein sorting-associated protein Ist1 [Helianthus annuus]|nr:putative vacuolar protein sorting-associated protein Ist1 [Helianthus annuus]KAJ0883460.1 putative vacuolar protein sorting-associated protein Ist1 [Helianthus annuus]